MKHICLPTFYLKLHLKLRMIRHQDSLYIISRGYYMYDSRQLPNIFRLALVEKGIFYFKNFFVPRKKGVNQMQSIAFEKNDMIKNMITDY